MGDGIRNNRIDILRGVAILLVLLTHFHISFDLHNSFLSYIIPESILHSIGINGNYGVTMFFTISGFLITSMSQKRYGSLENINILHFYSLRFARIFPCILLALSIILVLASFNVPSFINESKAISQDSSSMAVSIISVITFWHNITMQYWGYFNYAMNTYWSLSVEEMFYLAFPIYSIFLKRDWLIFCACAVILFSPLYRDAHKTNDIYYLYSYAACFDAVLIGCLAALFKDSKIFQNKYMQVFALSSLIITFYIGIHDNITFGFSIIALSTAILLIGSTSKQIDFKPMQFIGRISYELYLFHIIILGLMRDIFKPDNLNNIETSLLLFIFIILSIFSGSMISRYYSEPLNQKIREYLVSKTRKV